MTATESSWSGSLRKMLTVHSDPVEYTLKIGESNLPLNPLLGRSLTLMFEGQINCINCGRGIRKSFSQGYCFPCFRSLAETDLCIMSPERCHYDAGTCRDPAWGEQHCMQPHVVYLANSSGLKVGITRKDQVPVRWMDQGAIQAMPVARVTTRRHAGLLEASLREFVSDRTQWQRMLKGEVSSMQLNAEWQKLQQQAQASIDALKQEHGDAIQLEPADATDTYDFSYPVENHPDKVRALNLDKQPIIEGVLEGIKGQYLILDRGVLNVRKFTGYVVTVRVD